MANKITAANLITIPITGASGSVYNGAAVVNCNTSESQSLKDVDSNNISVLNNRILNKFKY